MYAKLNRLVSYFFPWSKLGGRQIWDSRTAELSHKPLRRREPHTPARANKANLRIYVEIYR